MKLIFLTDDKEEIVEQLEELFRKEHYKQITSKRNGISISIVKPQELECLDENVLLRRLSTLHIPIFLIPKAARIPTSATENTAREYSKC